MIYLGNVWSIEPSEYDEVWVICRSVGELNDMFNTYTEQNTLQFSKRRRRQRELR